MASALRAAPSLRPARGAALLALALGPACQSDNKISSIAVERVAVTTGDFDRVEESLARNGVVHDVFEGYISIPVYDPEADAGAMSPKVEELFSGQNEDGYPLTVEYDAIFVNSGTRGFGAFVYNGLESDDSLVNAASTGAAIDAFLEQPRTLVVSDWAWELVEANFPDQIQFQNEELGLDGAQVGLSDRVTAEILDPKLAENALSDTLDLSFDFQYWAVMASVGPEVDVYLRGDIELRGQDGEGAVTLQDVPLLVGFDAGAGRVLYSSFSWKAQRPAVTDLLLLSLIEGLQVDTNADDEAAAQESTP